MVAESMYKSLRCTWLEGFAKHRTRVPSGARQLIPSRMQVLMEMPCTAHLEFLEIMSDKIPQLSAVQLLC